MMPEPGNPLPDIGLETAEGGQVTPARHHAEHPGRRLVLFFYPRDNTPGCTAEAQDFSALHDRFAAAGTDLLGISKDTPRKHRNFIARHGLTVPLATDAQEGGLSDALGLWREKQMYGKTYMGMVRTTILLDGAGNVLRIWPKVRVKGHAQEVLATVEGR
ncbi:peroxiredoxin [Pseudopontixanthobacter vadosimaris]|uniref:peroxiredoxin n=1 Tax=Pseudopontixanthobacter vadosimaris TaxID=2726450 RepID=UPI00147580E1|nr:peroxiredoxin [Pseudopontixanthobacter vadosimaris]